VERGGGKAVFKEEKVATLRILAALIAISALAAALAGVIVPGLYRPIVSDEVIPFTYGQDVISLIAAVLLLTTLRSRTIKTNIVQVGVVGYLFYAYAPYVMGTLYNYFYFLYIAVLGLSIFYFIIAFVSIEYEKLEFAMPTFLRMTIAIFCIVIVVLFAPQWIVAILKNIQTATWPGRSGFSFMYYVYILDLCFVLPVCALTAIFLLQKNTLGFLLGGIIPMKGFTLMLSVASGFFCQPLFQQKMSVGDAAEFSILSLVFLLLVVFYFARTKAERRPI
jgi:hypothetical protein